MGEELHSHKHSDTYHFLVLKRDQKPHPNWFEHFNLFIVRLAWPSVITRVSLVAANVHEGEVALDQTEATGDLLLCDRYYWLPEIKARLHLLGIVLVTPFRSAKHAPPHSGSAMLGRVCYRIDTVVGELIDRCGVKRFWAVIAGICAIAS